MKNLVVASLFGALVLMSSCSRNPASYVDNGNELRSKGKYDDAAINYRKAIQRDANYGPAYLALGKVQLEMKDGSGAYESLLHASQLMPENTEAQIAFGDLAVTMLVQDKAHPKFLYDQVSKLQNAFLAKDSNSFDGLRYKGYLALVDRKPAEAVEAFLKARQLKSSDGTVGAVLVEALFQAGRTAEGEKLGLEQIESRKATAELYDALYWHYRGIQHVEDAEAVLKKKVANFPANAGYLFQLALHYDRTGNPDEMRRILTAYVQNKKEHPIGSLQVGDFYTSIGRMSEAAAAFEQGAKDNPSDAETYKKRLANVYLNSGRQQDAQTLVDGLYQKSPSDVNTRAVRASLWSQSKDPADVNRSITEFQELLKERDKDPVLHFGLGQALWRQGKLDDARRECQTAVSLNPNLAPPRYILADIAVAQNNTADLQRQAQELVRLQPSSVRANRFNAVAMARSGRISEARSLFQRLLTANPGDIDTRIQLASLEIGARQFGAAETVLNASAAKEPAAELRLLPARVELRVAQNQPKQALALLTEASRKQPDNKGVRLLLARTAVRVGEVSTAIDQYKYLITQARAPELYYEMARAQEFRGDSRSALTAYEEMKRVAPGDPRAEFGMGRVCEALGQNAAAIAHYESAVQAGYDDPQLFVNLSFLLSDSGGNVDRALELARKAQAKLPDNPAVADALAYAFLKKNVTDNAMPVFSDLVRRYPKASTYRYHYALALLQKGDKSAARRELQACLKNPQPEAQSNKVHALLASLQ